MNKNDDFSIRINIQYKREYLSAFLLFFVSIFLIYSNSFDCSWHFDDYINIVGNRDIQITDLSWHNIEKGLYGVLGSDRWQRPVSYFSFALNYYFGGLDVFGYHIVNISIHCLTAFTLFIFIHNTLNLPVNRHQYGNNAYSIALLSAFLWAINPVQVTSVTYIVQRMASMVTLFYIIAMYLYIKGRASDIIWERIMYYFLCILCGVLAFGTKENAAMLPISIFMYDLILIQGVNKESVKKALPFGIVAVITTLVIAVMYIGDITTIQSDYKIRPFSMIERILTQPRVLIFYISLLIYPITSRMMLIHDVELSRSLLEPWTTIPAILAIMSIITFAFWNIRKRPLIAFCIIFFFLNHVIEGSFIALELIYEHRNYLPSMFFFLPLSIIIIKSLQYFYNNKTILYFLVIFMIAVIVIQGVTVYIQNNIYKDDITLWTDNVEKAPNLHHVRQNLATTYFVAGRFSEAFEEATLALMSYQAANPSRKARTYGLLGEYHYIKGDGEKALVYFEKSLRLEPTFHTSYRRIAEINLHKNLLQEAEQNIRKGLSIKPSSYVYHGILARIMLKKHDPDGAIKEARISLLLNGNQRDAYDIISEAFKLKRNERMAKHFEDVAKKMTSYDLEIKKTQILMQAVS